MIPEEAVEAATEAIINSKLGDHPGINGEEFVEAARAALEAVAPYMAAQVWDEGAMAGWKQSGEGFNAEYPDESTGGCSVDLSANPYRTKS